MRVLNISGCDWPVACTVEDLQLLRRRYGPLSCRLQPLPGSTVLRLVISANGVPVALQQSTLPGNAARNLPHGMLLFDV